MKKCVKIILLIFFAIILGGVGVLSFLGRPLQVKTNTKLDGVSEELCDVLYYGSFAANSHNMQSWKTELNIDDRQITVSIDPERTLEHTDPEYREMYISLGCYIQSICFSFDAYGYDTEVEYPTPSSGSNQTAAISFTRRENAEIKSEQIETIKRRHTDKSAYSKDEIDDSILDDLLKNNIGIYCYKTGSEEFEYIKIGTLEAITAQAAAQSEYMQELNKWMRFSDKEVESKKDGISAEMIGLKGIIKALYYLTTNHNSAEKDAFADQGISTAQNQLENCGTFFVITGGDTVIDWIEAGRKTQEFWYRCVENNIAVQPLSAMLETAPYSKEIKDKLGVTQNVQMILRCGYVKNYGENAAVRRDLNEYVTVLGR